MSKEDIKTLREASEFYKEIANCEQIQAIIKEEKNKEILDTVHYFISNLEEACKIIDSTKDDEMDSNFLVFIVKTYNGIIKRCWNEIQDYLYIKEKEKHEKMRIKYLQKIQKN